MTHIQLTPSQRLAADAFQEFLDGDGQVFLLKGAAGTGKTLLVSEFLRLLSACGRDFKLMASTGRAAYIAGCKAGLTATTVHRGIYSLTRLKSTGADKDGEGSMQMRFGLRTNRDSPDAVYLVDEASMISDCFSDGEAFSFGSGRLLTDLFGFAAGRKIVFVGDYAQLPPVGMNFSPALDRDYLESQFDCKVTEVVLREVVRQKDQGVMLLNSTRIRDCIEKKTFIEFKVEKGVDSIPEDDDLLKPYYRLSPERPSTRCAVIAYSNRQALDYNLAIRRHYYGGEAPRLKAGDLLMVCRNNYAYEHELFNGNIVQVEACQPDSEVERRQVRVKTGKDRIEAVELVFRKVRIRFSAAGEPVSLNVTLLDSFLDDPAGSMGGLPAGALVVDFNNRLPAAIKSRLGEIKRLMGTKDALTAEQQRLCDEYMALLSGDPYYNAVVCKYGYAMTCHKAQGGEWDNVFVDMCRFGGTANEAYFRWAYTALTRAAKKVWHFRSPEFSYISRLAVEEIKMSKRIKVSNYAGDADFREARLTRLADLAKDAGLEVGDDRSRAYQHLVAFADGKENKALFQLWYNDRGYSGREILLSSTSEDFSALCLPLVEASYAPGDVPFEAPGRPFAEKLVAFVRTQLEETGIQLLDITQESYQDVFHLKTEGLAQMGLAYNAQGSYTYMRLASSLGADDTKLQALRERFV